MRAQTAGFREVGVCPEREHRFLTHCFLWIISQQSRESRHQTRVAVTCQSDDRTLSNLSIIIGQAQREQVVKLNTAVRSYHLSEPSHRASNNINWPFIPGGEQLRSVDAAQSGQSAQHVVRRHRTVCYVYRLKELIDGIRHRFVIR